MRKIFCRQATVLAAAWLAIGPIAGSAPPAAAAEPKITGNNTPKLPAGAPGFTTAIEGKAPMSVVEQPFGQTPEGSAETLLTLTDGHGAQLKLTTYGARIVAVVVPDRDGKLANVTLGFDKFEPYLTHKCFLGTTTGRFANRIAKGRFELDGKTYTLATNNGPNALHGGLKGFDKAHWAAKPLTVGGVPGVEFSYRSPDGDQGYPGNMDVKVVYTWSNDNALTIDYTATTDKPTILNLTNHAYWKLSDSPTVLDDILTVNADEYLATDETSIPLGKPAPVKGTAMDFTTPHVIGERIDELKKPPHATKGYDHCYVLRGQAGKLELAARVEDPRSGRTMDVLTTEPGVQLYCGNFLEGDEKSGGFHQHEGLCLETQHYPDSPNQAAFPTTVLRPSQTYRQTTVYRFGVKK